MDSSMDSPLWFRLNKGDIMNEDIQLSLEELPPICPRFFVPNIQDKPQDPILDSIKLAERNRNPIHNYAKTRSILPPELNIITDDILQLPPIDQEESIWTNIHLPDARRKAQLLSWDALRPTNPPLQPFTPFLSERGDLVYASARYHVQPRLQDASTHIVYIPQTSLFASLKITVLGNSSLYHTWNSGKEEFVQRDVKEGQRGFLLLDGKDEVISDSVTSRFLKIGTLLRRLDLLLARLRHRFANDGPTVHAFAHALSNILIYLRKTLTQCPPSSQQLKSGNIALTYVWLEYALHEDVLDSLAELCGVSKDKSPLQYENLDMSPINLLSRIYRQLDKHMNQQSHKTVISSFAYILTCTSQEYLHQVAQSVGFGSQPTKKQERIANLALDEYTLDEDAIEEEEDIFQLMDSIDSNFPSFFPPELLGILPAAQRSLILLKKAQPDHSLLGQSNHHPNVNWFWKKEDIEATWLAHALNKDNVDIKKTPSTLHQSNTTHYHPELKALAVFDLEPGTGVETPALNAGTNPEEAAGRFIDSFPDSLPSITPTLTHLSSIVFSNLYNHASSLSSTLLELFLDHPGELNYRSHLILLRDFLLLTSAPFKSRLSDALFSDKEDYEIDNKNRTISLHTLRQRKQITESTQPWAVGLASALLEREIWPPVGADLSFFLRTVIVDSLEYPEGSKVPKQVVNDAAWRLGFAVRDLPVGSGRDKWLNPLCVEALDFLYMDYKPPHPLEVLIPYEVLGKYQRMFTFLLRLLRVEHSIHAVNRMIRSQTAPIFQTLVAARKLTLHFRFIAQNFISSLSGYVFDTVIGGNFDPFLAQLTPQCNTDGTGERSKFTDVFELAQRHSNLLDDILSACLMRSGQKAAGDLLRQSIETVLDFSVVIGELRRGRLQEYEAAPLVEDLYARFRRKMSTLSKVLKGLVEKNSSKSTFEHLLVGQQNLPGGVDALHHLLLRLDLSDWWVNHNHTK